MGDSTRHFDISVGSTYSGSGLKSATADVAKLRRELALPVQGPLNRLDSLVEKEAASRIRAMERAAEKSQVGSIVNERLFGGGAEPTEKQAESLGKVAQGAAKAKQEASGLLAIITKFGTSNGTDALIEKFAKLAPKVGVALAITKAFSTVLEVVNFSLDEQRHKNQGNLDRLVEDDKKREAALKGIPIVGPLGAQIQKLNPFSKRRENEAAIEALEDATKIQEQHIRGMMVRAQAEGQLRLSSRSATDALNLQFSKRNQTSQRGTVLDIEEQQRQLERSFAGLPNGAKLPQEAIEQRRALAKAHDLALEDEAKAHARAMAGIESESNQAILEAQGRGREAQREALKHQLADQLQDIYDADQKRAQGDANSRKLDAFDQDTAQQRVTLERNTASQISVLRLQIADRTQEAERESFMRSLNAGIEATKDAEEKRAKIMLAPLQRAAFDIDKLKEKWREIRDIAGETSDISKRAAGFNLAADLDRIDRERREALDREKDADKRAAINANADAKVNARKKQDLRELDDVNDEHRQRLLDSDANLASRRLKLMGHSIDAEKLALKQQLADRIIEIDRARDKEIDAHAERAPLLRALAEEDKANARKDYFLSQEELQASRSKEYAVHGLEHIEGPTKLLTGVGGQISNSEPQVKATEAVRKAIESLGVKLDKLAGILTNSPGLETLKGGGQF